MQTNDDGDTDDDGDNDDDSRINDNDNNNIDNQNDKVKQQPTMTPSPQTILEYLSCWERMVCAPKHQTIATTYYTLIIAPSIMQENEHRSFHVLYKGLVQMNR